MSAIRHYALVTAAYWAFTVTDGALRMLVLLHFHALGYGPAQLALLFLFYEACGVVTTLVGGFFAGARGLHVTLVGGLALQVVALLVLSLLDPAWPRAASVLYVMASQALSGIAKDLTKVSAKSSLKLLVPAGRSSRLFGWVALLTGSKNALKGVGFFVGGVLLGTLGFRPALSAMAAALALVVLVLLARLPRSIGKSKAKPRWSQLLSKSPEVNVLSAARLFLFGARDVWFVVGVPVFLASTLGWSFVQVGSFLAAWVIGYGVVQSIAPWLLRASAGRRGPERGSAQVLAFALAAIVALLPLALAVGASPVLVVLGGLGAFGVVFALNSAVHSYLVLAFSDGDRVSLDVGFYYMANAAGRLLGTLLSGISYELAGLAGCLWASAGFALLAGLLSLRLPPPLHRARAGA